MKQDLVEPAWQAQWIWAEGEQSPRNEWRCFRRSFAWPGDAGSEAVLRITADSRYVLYVNGKQTGRGPVRSWPFELAYDEYEIGHLLRADAPNTIAVLVMHYGVSTFQYIKGRGGLLAELGCPGRTQPLLVTDASWQTALHGGYDRTSSRMSCQLGFTEIIDARAWDDTWLDAWPETEILNRRGDAAGDGPGESTGDTAGDAAGIRTDGASDRVGGANGNGSQAAAGCWEPAVVIGPAGMEPWVRLVKRPIPHLAEEPMYPSRIEAMRAVKPAAWTAVIDLRNHLAPESVHHANNILFVGYLATVIRLEQPARITLGSPDDGRVAHTASINGIWYGPEAYTGSDPEKYLTVELPAGDHLALIHLLSRNHGHGFHFGVDSDQPFELRFPLPDYADGEAESPFLTLGPFDAVEVIDHQPGRELRLDHPDLERARSISSAAELREWTAWVRPVPGVLVNRSDVFASSVWTSFAEQRPVPQQLHAMVTSEAAPGIVPVFPGLDTEVVIDFGRELSGFLDFEFDAAAGTIIDFYGFEYMNEEGWRQHTYQLDNTLRYVCREGRQSYRSPVRRGLRYVAVTIRGASRPVRWFGLRMIQSHYPAAETGAFQSSDRLLNDIWSLCRHTTRLCMEDTFVDCPAYEQTYWVGDARNEALINYYVFGAKDIVRHSLRLVPGSSFQTPLYVDQVPSGWSSVIPNWTFFWVTACLEFYRFSGDARFAADIWPSVSAVLDRYLERRDADGLLRMKGWNFLDWAPFEQPGDGVVTPQNMFLVKSLREAALLAEAIGQTADGSRLAAEAKRLREAINAHLWDEDRQVYVDCVHADGRMAATTSMQTQVVASLCGIAEGSRAGRIEAYIASPPAAFVPIGSPFMSFFYYEALAGQGRLDLLLADIRKQYGTMLDYGATACWETYARTDNPAPTRSHCHAWSAGPAYFLGAYVLGVRGLTPGWDRVLIAPHPDTLDWARGSVPLPDGGRIDVSWRIDRMRGQMKLRVSAPRSVQLEFQAPEGLELVLEHCPIG
ncbi:alpha-L-rhamnosidase [Paenibacillus sp. UNCCL117]|uniref:family 78 glycoside hydrolase catalytic domain n=1 Tax=unclassified Paenibacillus TaxID=185978 RepID=UPI000884B1AC|nr:MULTISPECIES: family 78 glycoside hydrolase catalytic domain [unclassified Paenibacillus]SDD70555.1 alpha-L-rhamnosidase [Paenibacillus sp. cl123]SFW45365.1 alpha-L-rhamnosidase [Paenibacillus sp. UNCCL117]